MTIMILKNLVGLMMVSLVALMSKSNTFMLWEFEMSSFENSLSVLCVMIIVMTLMGDFSSAKKKSYMMNLLMASVIFFSAMSFCSSNKFNFFLFFEISIIPMFVAILMFSKEKSKMYSAMIMILMNMAMATPTLMFIMKEFINFNTLNLKVASMSSNMLTETLLMMAVIFMMLSKAPMFFFHMWLPKAHVDAFTMGSVVLASLMIKLSVMGLIKFTQVMEENLMKMSWLLYSFSWCTLLVALIMMMKSADFKKQAATSSIVHMSVTLNASISMKYWGMVSSFMVLVSHGLVSSLMFLTVGLMYENSEGRSNFSNKSLESSCKTMSFIWIMVLFLNVGVPPTLSFFSEVYLVSNFMFMEMSSVLFISLSMVLISNASMLSATKTMFFKKEVSSSSMKGVYLNFSNILYLLIIWNVLFLKLL